MSRLVEIELVNFMSLKSAVLVFDSSNIINIIGFNDTGKSAITRALEVIFYDAYYNDQVNFIMDGQDSFCVSVSFDDGVQINKYKYRNGQSVWEMWKSDLLVYTNRLNNGVSSLGGIPEVVQNYLGVVKDDSTGEELNVRRNTDKLFLINTSGGDNYKMINSILRVDILAESVNRLNSDRNKLQSDITSGTTQSLTLKGELQHLSILDEHVVDNLSTTSSNLRAITSRVEYLYTLIDKSNEFSSIFVHDDLSTLDVSRLKSMEDIFQLREKVNIPVPSELLCVDHSRVSDLESILGYMATIKTPVHEDLKVLDVSALTALESILSLSNSKHLGVHQELELVFTERFKDIKEIGMSFNEFFRLNIDLANVDSEYQKTHSQLHSLSQQYGFKVCKNCGSIVE